MKDVRVSRRYAAALFGIARRDGILDAVTQDVALIERFIAEVPYLRAVLLQPLVSETKKTKVATDAFGDRVTATSLNFVKLLIRKRREGLIDECIRDFRALVAEAQNRIDAVATTAVPISPQQTERLTESLRKLTGKNVHLTTAVDPSIMGGTVVRMGDTIIDGSVRGRLERLEQQLLSAGS
jgi:F-type H+-transporting ATPase subunit delta